MNLKYVLEKEIEKLNHIMSKLGCIDLMSCNYKTYDNYKKKLQGQLNDTYSIIVDVKMDLEKIIKKLGE